MGLAEVTVLAEVAEYADTGPMSATDQTSDPDADLELVIARARGVWDEAVIADWLDGSNAHLGGATPREMIRRGRTAEVLDAITGDEAGVYD